MNTTAAPQLPKSKFAEVLEEVPEGDERNRAAAAAMVYLHRVGGMRPSDAARNVVSRWKMGVLDSWEQINKDAHYGDPRYAGGR